MDFRYFLERVFDFIVEAVEFVLMFATVLVLAVGTIAVIGNGIYLVVYGKHMPIAQVHADTFGGIVSGIGLLALGYMMAKFRSLVFPKAKK